MLPTAQLNSMCDQHICERLGTDLCLVSTITSGTCVQIPKLPWQPSSSLIHFVFLTLETSYPAHNPKMVRDSARLSAGNGEAWPQEETTPTCDSGPQTKSFRFLDLPAELRNRIYSYAFCGEPTPKYSLAKFQFPPIALVCKQMRSESLPILFSECHFILTIGSNCLNAHSWRNAGNLGLQCGTKRCLRLLGSAAVFRHVTFRIFTETRARGARKYLDLTSWQREDIWATMDIETHPKPKVTTLNQLAQRPQYRYPWQRPSLLLPQLRSTLQAAENLMNQICQREEFKGLTLSDLDKMAKCFRLKLDTATNEMVCG
ncbi:hypothetical protein AC579_1781 [Pseudocercospora musae]|uniref:F-box domain-containing protein n=1 Tax=Pseudocercospora musae TaxID=113226 RepID=A0A139IP61_9PEZI|nr:hypothetical protein AC579_1781 [Pseudocercospora musae]